jgi:hypothetical protein
VYPTRRNSNVILTIIFFLFIYFAEVEKILFVEKRKTAYRGVQGDPETSGPNNFLFKPQVISEHFSDKRFGLRNLA